jgi:CRISPR-associated endonuclease/helicase Cas3
MEPYLAHIAKDGRKQTVLEHLQGTAALAKEFALPFGGGEQAELAGLAHDLGKYTTGFQRRLEGGPKVDHATAGAFLCCQTQQPFAAFAAMGHHGGLPDGGGKGDGPESGTFLGRINKAAQGRLESCEAWRAELSLPSPMRPAHCDTPLEGMFFTRMLYSCLVDADYLDTEAFMEGRGRERGECSMEQLWEKLRQYTSGWFPPKGELNRRRCAILDQCMREGEERAPGLFTLTVPTGGGKTVASLAFAIAHAKRHGLRRVIYVIPYTSIIEQTAQTFRDILGAENVLEHHSNVLYDLEGEASSKNIRLAKATENWDAPVVVTTAVQFFESLYASRPSQCRKLHNIAGSVVIFDEAQMLPIPYLRPCVHAISQLVGRYHVSAVLCTATQPALGPIFQEFLPDILSTELCLPELREGDVFRRVTFRKAGPLSWGELAEALHGRNQALCVVNTRKSARVLYELLSREGCFHLSTLMTPAHRRAVLEEIRQRLKEGLPCRVVSTSLIEAGVDVDFPAVWREEAGLDSILQAAGRCNREGGRPVDESMVTIFRGEAKIPPLFATAVGAGRTVMERMEDPTAPEAIHDYFRELLDLKGKGAQDVHHILDTMRQDFLPFRTVSEQFHLIESATRTVYIPLEEGRFLVERLQAGERSRNLFRALGQYGVSVYEGHFAALEQAGELEVLEDGSAILQNFALYSPETGLSLEADSGKGLFI